MNDNNNNPGYIDLTKALDGPIQEPKIIEEQDDSIVSLPEFYENYLKGLPKEKQKKAVKQDRDPLYSGVDFEDFERAAFDNLDITGKYLDKDNNEKQIEGSEYDTFDGTLFGYKGKIYAAPIMPEESSISEDGTQFISNKENWHTKLDENQKYRFLVPAINPETGKYTAKEFIGTKEEAKKAFITLPRKYGVSEYSDNFLRSLLKGGMNTLNETDDIALGVAKLGQYGLQAMGVIAEEETELDKVYNTVIEDTEQNSYIASQRSEEFGSWDWLGNGLGAGGASLVQFGVGGRIARLGAMAAKSLGGSAVKTVLASGAKSNISKAVLKKATVDNLSSLGASGFIGYGFGYNEAIKNGLSEGEAVAFGLATASVNSLIEVGLGRNLDKFLTGSSQRNIVRDIIREVNGDLTEEGLAVAAQNVAKKAINSSLGQTTKNAGTEAFEEVLQTSVEQGAKMAFDALFADRDDTAGKGKFGLDEFDFEEIISAGIFGFGSSLPFSIASARSGHNTVASHILNGEYNAVKGSLDKLYFDGKVTADQYKKKLADIETMNTIFVENKDAFDSVSGDFRDLLRLELLNKHIDRAELIVQKDEALKANEALDSGLSNEERIKAAEDTKKKIDEIEKQIQQANKTVEKYKDPEFIGTRNKTYEEGVAALKENQANDFAKYLVPAESVETNVSKILEREDGDKIRNVKEAEAVLKAIQMPDIEDEAKAALINLLQKELVQKGFHIDDRINNDENIPVLTSIIGIDPALLPNKSDDNPARIETQAAISGLTYDQIHEAMQQGQFSKEQLHAADQSSLVKNYLSDEEAKAFAKLLKASANPVAVLLHNANGSTKGLYSGATGAMVLSANLERAAYLKNLKTPTKKEQKEFKTLSSEIFHRLVHESTHSLLDAHISKLHSAWVQAINNGVDTNESMHFQRLLDLAVLTSEAFKGKTKNQYFLNKITDNYRKTEGNIEAQTKEAKTFVKEFFAEAVSNKEFQQLLDTFDLNDPKNAAIVKGRYDYQQVQSKSHSILAEVQRAIMAVFNGFRDFFTKKERTLLKEAFQMANTIQVNKSFRKDSNTVNIRRTETAAVDQAMSLYGGTDVFPDVTEVDILNIPEHMIAVMESFGITYQQSPREDQRAKTALKIESLLRQTILKDYDNGSLLRQSVKVIYYENTDTTLVTWVSQDSDGNQNNKRIFINRFGGQVFVNTNPFNTASKVTLSKHNAFDRNIFSVESDNDAQALEKRAMINNLRKAQAEGFTGEINLQYDEDHHFYLKGKPIYGQITVMYNSPVHGKMPIGYTHDLTKVRLSKLLQNGASLKMRVDPDDISVGSLAYIKVDENGDIVRVENAKGLSKSEVDFLLEDGYFTERITPNINMLYEGGQTVSPENLLAANHADTVTPDDAAITPEFEVRKQQIIDEYLSDDDISFFNNDDPIFSEDRIGERIQYVLEGFKRLIRLKTAKFPELTAEEVEVVANEIVSKMNDYLLSLDNLTEEEHARIALLDFESEEALLDYLQDTILENYKIVRSQSDREDTQDWEGHGKSSEKMVSKQIRYAIEALNFTHEGLPKQWMEYSDAKEVLFPAADATDSVEEFLQNLKGISQNDGVYSARSRTIAGELYKMLTRKSKGKEGEWLEKAINSWYSQFASYRRVRALTLVANGDGAYFIDNGRSAQIREDAKALISPVMERIAIFKKNAEQRIKPESKFSKSSQIQMMFAQGSGLYNDEKGKTINLIQKINTNIPVIAKAMESGDFTEEQYNAWKQDLYKYLNYIGLELDPALLGKQLDGSYKTVSFEKSFQTGEKGSDNRPIYSKLRGQHTFLELYYQVAHFVNNEIQKDLTGGNSDYGIKELHPLAEKLLQMKGEYKSPEFYHDNNLNKRWANKIRNYSGDLFDKLYRNKNGILDKYLASSLYKNNPVLKRVQELKGEPIDYVLSHLDGFDGTNTNYTDASGLDFMYMQLGMFNAIGVNSDEYFHIDDIPSDKPNVDVYRLEKVYQSELASAIKNILRTENVREQLAKERFREAFTKIKGTENFRIEDQEAFNNLVERVDFKRNKDGTFSKGDIFNRENYFYGDVPAVASLYKKLEGASAAEKKSLEDKISQAISKAIIDESKDLKSEFDGLGLTVPVSKEFIKLAKDNKNYPELLEKEKNQTFNDFYTSFVINRYHLSFLTMGDYIYYKSGDDFVDLSKRKAGSYAPRSKANWKRDKAKFVALYDPMHEESGRTETPISFPVYEFKDGRWVESDRENNTSSDRSDAQMFITEDFAAEIEEAYGSLSGYANIFKPVGFSVDPDTGKPLYLKVSAAKIPNPDTEAGAAYYEKYPEGKAFAIKFYASKADAAVFTTGIKVGMQALNEYGASEYVTQDFDLRNFGMQNNPNHEIDEDDLISGLVQPTKQWGDNGNYEAMRRYHELESTVLRYQAEKLFAEELSTEEGIREALREQLGKQDHTKLIALFLDNGVSLLDNPVTSTFAQNLVSSLINKRVSLAKRSGSKLVNRSDLGMTRPMLSEAELQIRSSLLKQITDYDPTINEYEDNYSGELRWMGTRFVTELTNRQLQQTIDGLQKLELAISPDGMITYTDGSPKIYPSDVLVPEGTTYIVGDPVLATRIPSSAKTSTIAGEVVGTVPADMGNIIIVGKEGPGLLGFDFDVDGLFTWRKDSDPKSRLNQMFDIAYGIMLDPKNFNEITTPIGTNRLTDAIKEIDRLLPESNKKKHSKFGLRRQLELHKLNMIGKKMIGVSARSAGIHSVLSQNKTPEGNSPLLDSTKGVINRRGYYMAGPEGKGVLIKDYPTQYTDENGNTVLVSDIFNQLINSSTDNAKEQQLGKLNINMITASVLMDMVSHGIDFNYALFFINQPIIKRLVEVKELQSSAVFKGNKEDAYVQIIKEYEYQARQIAPDYQFNKMNNDGSSAMYRTNGILNDGTSQVLLDDKGRLKEYRQDRRIITMDSLKDGISGAVPELIDPEMHRLHLIDNQLAILDKFRYYSGLAAVTNGAGDLISLASKYPKTYLDIYNTKKRIDSVTGMDGKEAKIDIENLISEMRAGSESYQPYYQMQYENLGKALDLYERNMIYANPLVRKMHDDIAGFASVDVQKKVMDDFYTWIFTNAENFPFDLSTRSFNGNNMDPYLFVDKSSRAIKALKEKYPDNEFLKKLQFKESKVAEDKIDSGDRTAAPAMITSNLLVEVEGSMLEAIHKAFDELNTSVRVDYETTADGYTYPVEIDIQNSASLILGNLLYTKGFGMGGFSFSKLLPVHVIRSMDAVIAENKVDFEIELDQIANDESKEESIKERVSLLFSTFKKQAKLNHPSLIRDISNEQAEELKRLSAFKINPDKTLKISRRDNSLVIQRLLSQLANDGIIRTPRNGKIYEVESIKGFNPITSVVLKEVNFVNTPGINQYSRQFENIVQLSDEIPELPEASENMDYRGIPLMGTDKIDLAKFEAAEIGEPETEKIENGVKTGNTIPADQIGNIKAGSYIKFISDEETVISRVTRSPYHLGSAVRAIDANPERGSGKEIVSKGWAKAEGVPIEYWKTNEKELLESYQFRHEYVATIDNYGNVLDWGRNERPGEEISKYDNDEEVNPEQEKAYIEFRTNQLNAEREAEIQALGESYDEGQLLEIHEKYDKLISNIRYIPGISDVDMEEEVEETVNPSVAQSLIAKIQGNLIEPYTTKNAKKFFAALKRLGVDAVEFGMLQDFLYSNNIESATPEQIIEMLTSGKPGKYADLWFHDKKGKEIAKAIFREEFEDFWTNIESYKTKEFPKPEINHVTGKPFTYYEEFERAVRNYEKEENYLLNLQDRFGELGEGIKDMTNAELKEAHEKIAKFNTANGLAKENFKSLIGMIEVERTKRVVELHRSNLLEANPDVKLKDQEDIGALIGKNFLAITDFDTNLLAMQAWGKNVKKRADAATRAQESFFKQLQLKMNAVSDEYFHMKPKSWKERLNPFTRAKISNEPFDGLLERTENGSYFGRTIARYAENEDVYKAKFLEKEPNPQFIDKDAEGIHGIEFIYVMKNHDIAHEIVKAQRSGNRVLSNADIAFFEQAMKDYDFDEARPIIWDSLTEELREGYSKMSYQLRIIAAKAVTRTRDSREFVMLKKQARANTPEGRLAKAKIELYDFMYWQNDALLLDNGYKHMPVQRLIMPQVSMSTIEDYQRNGLFDAYLNFMGGKEYNEAYEGIEVDFNGKKQTFAEHVAEINNKDLTKLDKLQAPVKMRKLINATEDLIRSGKSNLRAEDIEFVERGLDNSSSAPFLTIRGRKDFSINMLDIFHAHFNNLIFKKFHDPLIMQAQATRSYYKQMSHETGKSFKNAIEYIGDYTDRTYFGKKDALARSTAGRLLRLMSTGTIMAHLGLSPVTSGYNLVVGMSEAWKDAMAQYGFVQGSANIKNGAIRLTGAKNFKDANKKLERIKKGQNNSIVFSPLADAIMERYGVRDFSKTDIQKHNDLGTWYQDFVMSLQTSTETAIRGVAFLGHLTEKQWNNFYLDDNGLLQAKNPALMPKPEEAEKWVARIERSQGNYSKAGRRNYHGNTIFSMAMLFKTWMVDYIQLRFRPQWTDSTGIEHEGYGITFAKLIKNHKRTLEALQHKDGQKLSKVEQENLRRIVYDVSMYLLLVAMTGFVFDDEDEDEKVYHEMLAKLSTQFYIFTDPQGILRNLNNPFPNMYILTQMVDLGSHIAEGELSKAADDIITSTPLKTTWKYSQEFISED